MKCRVNSRGKCTLHTNEAFVVQTGIYRYYMHSKYTHTHAHRHVDISFALPTYVCVAVCCSVLQCVAVCCSVQISYALPIYVCACVCVCVSEERHFQWNLSYRSSLLKQPYTESYTPRHILCRHKAVAPRMRHVSPRISHASSSTIEE